jgi:hypothetical protein
MKIITLHTRVNPAELREHIRENLDRQFKEVRQTEMHFDISGEGNTIEIAEHEVYKEVLYKIEAKGKQLHITRSEHYTDDVNSLTVESILNDLFKDLSDEYGTDLLQEG